MTTPRLDAYRRRLLELERRVEGSDASEDEVAALDPEMMFFKDDPRWSQMLAEVMAELRRRV